MFIPSMFTETLRLQVHTRKWGLQLTAINPLDTLLLTQIMPALPFACYHRDGSSELVVLRGMGQRLYAPRSSVM
jgi:hypothetical protein